MTSSPNMKAKKPLIEWSEQTLLPIEFMGREVQMEAFAYQGRDPDIQALALVHRKSTSEEDSLPVVRLHSGCVTGDVFHSLRCDCHTQLKSALERIASENFGVLIYLPYQEGRGIGLFRKIKAYSLQDRGLDTVDANLEQGQPIDARDYAFAGEILSHLKIKKIRLMTNNPEKIESLQDAGIEVLERIPLIVTPSPHNKIYLETKRRRLAHEL